MKIYSSEKAPKAIGPYSQAIRTGNLLFCSGQVPLDPETMNIVGENVEEQTAQVFKNIKGFLSDQGLTVQNVVKTMVFLKDMNDFTTFNGIYEAEFEGHKPARSCVEAARLPKDVLVEIECIAEFPNS